MLLMFLCCMLKDFHYLHCNIIFFSFFLKLNTSHCIWPDTKVLLFRIYMLQVCRKIEHWSISWKKMKPQNLKTGSPRFLFYFSHLIEFASLYPDHLFLITTTQTKFDNDFWRVCQCNINRFVGLFNFFNT